MKVVIPIKRKKKLKLPPATCQFYLSVLENERGTKKKKENRSRYQQCAGACELLEG
jgi:hypothetical protein